jgi:hypothetical protein
MVYLGIKIPEETIGQGAESRESTPDDNSFIYSNSALAPPVDFEPGTLPARPGRTSEL